VTDPVAPRGWFDVLLDEDDRVGLGLPEPFRAIYGGDWPLPIDDTYVYVNFCVARDGRVSFAEPGHTGGDEISCFDARDQWLMGLLRARADAVLVGDGTLISTLEHLWTAEFICPTDADAFVALRLSERRQPVPLTVFVSLRGDLPWEAAVFSEPSARIVIAATANAARTIEAVSPTVAGSFEVLAFDAAEVDIRMLAAMLATRFGVERLLCEGGPRLYGSLLGAQLPCDEFVTLSPLIVGDDRRIAPARPSLVEGVRFAPGAAPRSRIVSVRRGGDFLYLRSRYVSSD
jgi:riboflavin biosynthesis pyrimidine reductase